MTQTGTGWKTAVGSTLVGLGGLGAAGWHKENPIGAVIGGSIVGALGSALIHADKKGKGMSGSGSLAVVDRELAKNIKKFLRKAPHHIPKTGSGLKLAGQGMTGTGKPRILHGHVKAFLNKHKNLKLHISDLLGPDWQQKKDKLKSALVQAIKNRHQQGSGVQTGTGVFQDISKGVKKAGKSISKAASSAGKKMKDFIDGKTKMKPSTIMNYLGGAVGVVGAASAMIPGVDLISVPAASALALGLKGAAHMAKTAGSGLSLSGGADWGHLVDTAGKFMDVSELGLEGMEDPAKIKDAIEKLAAAAGPLLTKTKVGAALGITGAALAAAFALYKKLKKKKGAGLSLSGGALPPRIAAFVRAHPQAARRIAAIAKKGKGYQSGMGAMDKILGKFGLVGTPNAGVAHSLFNLLLENPKLHSKLGKKVVVKGKGMHGPGVGMGKPRRKKGMIVGTKTEVWDDAKPHQITSGGLRKCDLMKGKGNKIISKKRHALGKKLYEQNKGKLTPFK